MKSALYSSLVPIPDSLRSQLAEFQNHRGAQRRFAQESGIAQHVISRTSLGKQKFIQGKDLKRFTQALRTFDPGPRTPPRNYSGKRTKRALVRIKDNPVEVGTHNGNGTPAPAILREAGIRGLLDGMAIQAEITRRGIAEFLDGPTAS